MSYELQIQAKRYEIQGTSEELRDTIYKISPVPVDDDFIQHLHPRMSKPHCTSIELSCPSLSSTHLHKLRQ
jgi:hypothetical protein